MAKIINHELLKKLILETNKEITSDQILPSVDLFDAGILDSFAVMQLVQLLEEQFDIVFDYKDLRRDYFSSLEALQGLLIKKYDCVEQK